MKIGIISDVHSNFSALECTLRFLEDKIDALIIAGNIEDDPTIVEDALNSLVGDLEVTVEFTTKAGRLIKGFGVGLYGNIYSLLDKYRIKVNLMQNSTVSFSVCVDYEKNKVDVFIDKLKQ